MENTHFRNILELSLATILISTSAVLGKFINMPAALIIWWRSIIAFAILGLLCRYNRISLRFDSHRDLVVSIISGIFLAAHWITYFLAIKLSNVSIGMLSLFTFPTITSFLEPILSKTKFERTHLLLGIFVLIGIYFLVPEFKINNSQSKGVVLGIFSAILFSIRNIIIKQNARKYDGRMLMAHQLLIVTVVVLPCFIFLDTSNISTQYPYIILLALFSTVFGHSLFIKSLKHFSASTASIIISTQPIYGIIIAFLFLKEIPNSSTYIGGLLILSTVIIESVRTRKKPFS